MFRGIFDLNRDGNMDAAETALEFAVLEDLLSEESDDADKDFFEDD